MADFDALRAELRDWCGVYQFPLFISLENFRRKLVEAMLAFNSSLS